MEFFGGNPRHNCLLWLDIRFYTVLFYCRIVSKRLSSHIEHQIRIERHIGQISKSSRIVCSVNEERWMLSTRLWESRRSVDQHWMEAETGSSGDCGVASEHWASERTYYLKPWMRLQQSTYNEVTVPIFHFVHSPALGVTACLLTPQGAVSASFAWAIFCTI